MGDESRFRYRLDEGLARDSAAGARAPAHDQRALEPRGADGRGRAPRDYSRADGAAKALAPRVDPVRRDDGYGRAPASGRQDSLAELAKLIGDDDPFADFDALAADTAQRSQPADPYGAPEPRLDDPYAPRADRFAAPVPVRGQEGYARDAYERDAYARRTGAADPYAADPYAPAPADDRGYDDQGYDDKGYGAAGYEEPRYDASAYEASAYDERRYDDAAPGGSAYDEPEDEDDYDAPRRAAPQLPVRAEPAARAEPTLRASREVPSAAGRPTAGAVRTGYGSLARQQAALAAPQPAPDPAYDSRAYDARGQQADAYDRRAYDRGGYAERGYDDQAYDDPAYDARDYDRRGYDDRATRGYEKGAQGSEEAYDDRAYGDRAYDERGYDDRARGDRTHDDRARDDRTHDARGYDDGYDAQDYRAGERADARGYRDDGRGYGRDEAAYAYSDQRRRGADDGYDAYDDGYDPDFAEDGYMPPHGEDVYGAEPRRRKGRMALLMAISVIGLVVAGIAVFFAYRMAVGAPGLVSSGAPPVIRADASPSKIVSDTPPAAEGSQKLIYDRMGDGANPNERMVPREEQPVDVATASTGTTGASATEPKRVRTLTVRADGSVIQGGAAADAAPAPAGSPVSAYAPTQNPIPSDLPAPTSVSTVSTGSLGAGQTASLDTPPVSASGAYVVQVASQRSEADAMGSWRALQQRYPNLLGGYRASVKRADLGERGVYYRAQVGPFASRDQANDLCQALRGQGGDCLVSKN